MVCSFHFVDGEPSYDNPYPTLKLGYEKPKRPRRKLARKDLELSRIRTATDAAVLCDLDELCKEVHDLKLKKSTRKPFTAVSIKSDLKIKFYRGIQTVAVFNTIFSLIKPYVSKLVFWRGKKVISSAVNKKYNTRFFYKKNTFFPEAQFS